MRIKGQQKIGLIIIFVLITGCFPVANAQDINRERGINPIITSIVSLIAKPQEYNNRYIKIVGYAGFEEDGIGIYLHEDDYKNRITINGLWIQGRRGDEAKLNEQYVIIEGFFKAPDNTPQNLWSGSIETIRRFENWEAVRRKIAEIESKESAKE